MAKLEYLGIKRIEGIHYYVHDLERSRRFYTGMLDFAETWRSSPELEGVGDGRVVLILDVAAFFEGRRHSLVVARNEAAAALPPEA